MSKHRQYIEEQWKLFRDAAIPKNAPLIQLEEMRQAFYVGAAAIMALNNRLAEGDLSKEEGCQLLIDVDTELTAFHAAINKKMGAEH